MSDAQAEEIAALRRELAEVHKLASVRAQTTISALLALENLIMYVSDIGRTDILNPDVPLRVHPGSYGFLT